MAQKQLESIFSQQLALVSGVKRWVVGLSGGLDSMVLLALAAKTLPVKQLLVLHIDHQLQASSSNWSDFCRQQAEVRGVQFQVIQVSVDTAASLERAARDARYQAFAECLLPGDCLLLAHHNGDQAETMLFRLLRGTGVRGLAGIPVQRSLGQGRLLRPMLGLSKERLLSWAEEQLLQWVEDPSNQDLGFDRNFLRHKVMPLLESRWPGFSSRWGLAAEHLKDAQCLLNDLAQLDENAVAGSYGALQLDLLTQLSVERQDNLLRHWIHRLSGQLISGALLGNIHQTVMCASDDAQPEVLLNDFVLRRFRRQLYLFDAQRGAIVWSGFPLVEGVVNTAGGQLSVALGDEKTALRSLVGVELRNRLEGDRCRPTGRGGSCSLKKLFQENRIPAWLRDEWPVLVVGDEIVALPGICVCEGWQRGKNIPGFTLQWTPSALFARGESATL
ncbi:MAG: tRNA lysidine(34) synthetase TilS [Amphritea sp.]